MTSGVALGEGVLLTVGEVVGTIAESDPHPAKAVAAITAHTESRTNLLTDCWGFRESFMVTSA
jgi:hypothetical protein